MRRVDFADSFQTMRTRFGFMRVPRRMPRCSSDTMSILFRMMTLASDLVCEQVDEIVVPFNVCEGTSVTSAQVLLKKGNVSPPDLRKRILRLSCYIPKRKRFGPRNGAR